jgi:hypothetical protein
MRLNAQVIGHKLQRGPGGQYMQVTFEVAAHELVDHASPTITRLHLPVELAQRDYPIGSYHYDAFTSSQQELELRPPKPEAKDEGQGEMDLANGKEKGRGKRGSNRSRNRAHARGASTH